MKNISYTQSTPGRLQSWILAARPRTLPICLAPVLVGTLLAKGVVDTIDWMLALLAFLSVLFLQIGTNLVNDALDFRKGADTEERLGPKRMTQAGLLTFEGVLRGGLFCFGTAVLFGIPLVWVGGWPFMMILFFSVLCGYFYTGGPKPLAYLGLGEPFIFIFYGLAAVPAFFYLQAGFIDHSCWIAAGQMGLLAMVPNAINNLRDIRTDAKANKRTLAVRFGLSFARLEITLFSLIPFILGLAWIGLGKYLYAVFPLIALPLVIKNSGEIYRQQIGSCYQDCFGRCVAVIFLFALSLAVASLLS